LNDADEGVVMERLSEHRDLWTYLWQVTDELCPLYSCCKSRLTTGWCAAENFQLYTQLMTDDNLLTAKYTPVKDANFGSASDIWLSMEQLATDFLRLRRISEPPVPTKIIYNVDDRRSTVINNIRLKACGGGLFLFDNEWVVFINRNQSERAQRLTAFHEAFHILAYLGCGATAKFRGRGQEPGRYKEILADAFARHVLLPAEWVRKIWPKVNDLREMAKLFGAPLGAVWFRLRYLGLL